MSELTVQNLSKSFGAKKVLEHIYLACKTNEILGVFGRNGSGKSTMLKCIFGTLKADFIDIQIDKIPIKPSHFIPNGRMGYLPQETFLPKSARVKNVIPLYFPDSQRQDNIFYSPGINAIENKKIGELSYGQLRYFELILVSFLDHDFLLLDEPFSMIEPLYKNLIQDFLLNLKNDKGIILTDHYYDDVLAVSNKNILIKDGMSYNVNHKTDLKSLGYLY